MNKEKNMELNKVVENLTQSFSKQVEWYGELKQLVQKILGKISLSRGDFSQVIDLFEQKQQLLTFISDQREKSKNDMDLWQRNKHTMQSSEQTELLDEILEKTEHEIKSFLEIEEQLKKYIEFNMEKEG